jgi:hypothetical protein
MIIDLYDVIINILFSICARCTICTAQWIICVLEYECTCFLSLVLQLCYKTMVNKCYVLLPLSFNIKMILASRDKTTVESKTTIP